MLYVYRGLHAFFLLLFHVILILIFLIIFRCCQAVGFTMEVKYMKHQRNLKD